MYSEKLMVNVTMTDDLTICNYVISNYVPSLMHDTALMLACVVILGIEVACGELTVHVLSCERQA